MIQHTLSSSFSTSTVSTQISVRPFQHQTFKQVDISSYLLVVFLWKRVWRPVHLVLLSFFPPFLLDVLSVKPRIDGEKIARTLFFPPSVFLAGCVCATSRQFWRSLLWNWSSCIQFCCLPGLAFGGKKHTGIMTSSSNVVGVHYRVGKKIGEGSFGVIFEGTNLLNNQQVAIKFVSCLHDLILGDIELIISREKIGTSQEWCSSVTRWI